MNNEHVSSRIRLRVAVISIVMGILILAVKYYAYLVSGSTALKSDAIESVVNILAAFFALGAVIFADKPADREHPYGHGKAEHFSAAVEDTSKGGFVEPRCIFHERPPRILSRHGPAGRAAERAKGGRA